jgi:hypothetical protein
MDRCEGNGCRVPVTHRAVLVAMIPGELGLERHKMTLAVWACDRHHQELTKRQLFTNERWRIWSKLMEQGRRSLSWKDVVLEWEKAAAT